MRKLVDCLARLERLGHPVTVYPDAEELIEQRLFQRAWPRLPRSAKTRPGIRCARTLLKAELLPYQLDGIAFAVGAGRAVLADDMGLGKTIQGVGAAELLAREAGIRKVLVVCPASVKSQWRSEIHRFCDRDVQLVAGGAAEPRPAIRQRMLLHRLQLRAGAPRHPGHRARPLGPDHPRRRPADQELGIEDGPRSIKGLKSPFALVLSGTPLENRLDELYSVVQFVDDRRLPPAFRFFHRHRVVDEKGKVLGYKNLDQLRENLRPILLRRTRAVGAPATAAADDARSSASRRPTSKPNCTAATCAPRSMIARKPYISEMDLLRLQKALLMCRMAANSTFLVDKQAPGYSSKLDHLGELFDGLFAEPDRKAVLVLRVDHDARPHRAAARRSGSCPTCGWTDRFRKRNGNNWSTASATTRAAGCS